MHLSIRGYVLYNDGIKVVGIELNYINSLLKNEINDIMENEGKYQYVLCHVSTRLAKIVFLTSLKIKMYTF